MTTELPDGVEGTDYGRIHVVSKNKCSLGSRCRNPAHFSKPSLWKPGAEKICGMLGVTVHFPTLHDYEQHAIGIYGEVGVIDRWLMLVVEGEVFVSLPGS